MNFIRNSSQILWSCKMYVRSFDCYMSELSRRWSNILAIFSLETETEISNQEEACS